MRGGSSGWRKFFALHLGTHHMAGDKRLCLAFRLIALFYAHSPKCASPLVKFNFQHKWMWRSSLCLSYYLHLASTSQQLFSVLEIKKSLKSHRGIFGEQSGRNDFRASWLVHKDSDVWKTVRRNEIVAVHYPLHKHINIIYEGRQKAEEEATTACGKNFDMCENYGKARVEWEIFYCSSSGGKVLRSGECFSNDRCTMKFINFRSGWEIIMSRTRRKLS